jgi:ribosome-binding factor A
MSRVNETLREVIADEVTRLEDPRVGFVTITGVDTAPDLRNARVYYSVLGPDEDHTETQDGLDHAAPHIQEAVGRQVRLKYLPRLRFVVDESVERGMRIEAILRDIAPPDDSDE